MDVPVEGVQDRETFLRVSPGVCKEEKKSNNLYRKLNETIFQIRISPLTLRVFGFILGTRTRVLIIVFKLQRVYTRRKQSECICRVIEKGYKRKEDRIFKLRSVIKNHMSLQLITIFFPWS